MNISTIVIVSIGVAALILIGLFIVYKKFRSSEDPFEDMDGEEFEEFCAELLERKGFVNVELTAKSHDYGIDIFADYDGVNYAIQCKCYSDPVGIKAIQEAYAGKDYYCCMVAVVMTNQSFTKTAIEFASRLNVLLWDGDYVTDLIRKYGCGKKYQIVSDATPINTQEKKGIKRFFGK